MRDEPVAMSREGCALRGVERAVPGDDPRGDVDLLVVEVLTVVNGAVLAERFAVVAREKDDPWVGPAWATKAVTARASARSSHHDRVFCTR